MTAGPTAPVLDWAGRENADAYARFADTHDWYDRLAGDLLARAGILPRAVVVDLCCGAGALTRALLTHGDPASITAVDASAAMLDHARRRTMDSRVEWRQLPAQHLDDLGPARADAVLCSAAMWELPLQSTLAAVAAVLRPGGRLAFNLAADPARSDSWADRLEIAGFRLDRIDHTDHRLSGADVADWLSLPLFFPGPAGLDAAGRRQFLRVNGIDDKSGRSHVMPWLTVVAEKYSDISFPTGK